MPVEPEVNAGDGQVGGDREFVARAGTEQGAIVADAQGESPGSGAGCSLADVADEIEFAAIGFRT